MGTIIYLIQKEFLQVFRNHIMRAMIFVIPFVQLLILPLAATFELKNSNLVFVDHDKSTFSNKLISKFNGSPFFTIVGTDNSVKEAEKTLFDNSANAVIVIPKDFERDLIREKHSKIQLLINGIDGVAAGITNGYAGAVIMDFNKNIITENIAINAPDNLKMISMTYSHWFNPELIYSAFMVPGILVLLVTIIGLFLTSMNTVREKEIGTIEQINVTPIKKYQFIAGKLIPFWIIGLFELTVGLTLGKLVYDIPMVGDLHVVFAFAAIYLPAALGVGILISTITTTQQQAMLFSLFFTFIFLLMSGLFTPVESMPDWAQMINTFNPIAYFIKVMRNVLMKGSDFADLQHEFFALMIYSTVILSLAVWRYRKTS